MDPIERKFKILEEIINRYILTGEPVGSKTVSENSDLSFSSATVRNEMADLVSFGYLTQPHVSAGRVPSSRGYRLYINKLMHKKPLSENEKSLINGILSKSSTDPESLLEAAAEALAEITGFTSVVTTPLNQKSRVLDIKLVKISRRGAMIVLTTSSGMIKNKLFRCDYDISDEILKTFEKILSEEFRGKLLNKINPESVSILVTEESSISFLLLPIIKVFLETALEASQVEVKICGQKNLLLIPESTSEMTYGIFKFLEDKEKILNLLNCENYGINFTVGEENIYRELKNSSVCFSRYNVADKFGGLGIIGPTRMDYGYVTSYLQYVSSLIGVFLERILKGY